MKKIFVLTASLFLAGTVYNFKQNNFHNAWEIFSESDSEAVFNEFRGTVMGAGKVDEQTLSVLNLPIEAFKPIGAVPIKKESATDFYVRSHSAVALDVDSSTVLYYLDGSRKMQVASLTKIMTAVLAVENIKDLSEPVTITQEMVDVPGTRIGCPRTGYCPGERLRIGEKVRAINLLEAALINSTNDAATALGIHISGSEEKFAQLMNKRANELGLKNTNFCRPSGLEYDEREDECFSTAYDLARIVAYSLKDKKYDVIWKSFKISEKDFYSVDGTYVHHIGNTNLLLDSMPNCLGAKTGFTPMAGQSLFMAAADPSGERKVVVVLLDDPYRFEDARVLTEWVFESYRWE